MWPHQEPYLLTYVRTGPLFFHHLWPYVSDATLIGACKAQQAAILMGDIGLL